MPDAISQKNIHRDKCAQLKSKATAINFDGARRESPQAFGKRLEALAGCRFPFLMANWCYLKIAFSAAVRIILEKWNAMRWTWPVRINSRRRQGAMGTKMEALTGKVSFRVDEDTESLLIKLADDRKITKSAMGRICLMDGVSGFDRKHEALVLSIQGLQHQMGELLSIGRISLSATLLLRDSKDDNIEVAKARLLEEYRNAVAVAKLIQVQLAQLA